MTDQAKTRSTEVACEPCRRRKSRCDRVHPTCGSCTENSTSCVFITQRPQRGPKKGQLRALRAHVAALEKRLAEQQNPEASAQIISQKLDPELPMRRDSSGIGNEILNMNNALTGFNATSDISFMKSTDLMSVNINLDSLLGATWLEDLSSVSNISLLDSLHGNTPTSTGSGMPFGAPVLISPAFSPTLLTSAVTLDDVTRADLDALYFERVHPLMPMIHKGLFSRWSNQKDPPPAQRSLHYAMWTLASAVSARFRDLRDSLYSTTRHMLQYLGETNDCLPWTVPEVQLEQIQAWLLIACYEYMRMERHQSQATMNCTFRLVQASRLHIVDASNVMAGGDEDPLSFNMNGPDWNWVNQEMRRRTFWHAFCFDRLFDVQDRLCFTLQEEMTCLRLPASEVSFQSGRPQSMGFLSQSVAESSPMAPSLAEYIGLVALFGRCLTHRNLIMTAALDGKEHSLEDSRRVWRRHDWLAAALEKVLPPVVEIEAYMWDPIASFCRFLSRGAIIHLSETALTWMPQSHDERHKIKAYESRAYKAATEIRQLACALPRLACLKTHGILPNILSHAIVFLKRFEETCFKDERKEEETRKTDQLVKVLEMFEDVHFSARESLTKIREG